jgi:hypothetical protein
MQEGNNRPGIYFPLRLHDVVPESKHLCFVGCGLATSGRWWAIFGSESQVPWPVFKGDFNAWYRTILSSIVDLRTNPLFINIAKGEGS